MNQEKHSVRRAGRAPFDAAWYLLPAGVVAVALGGVLLWPMPEQEQKLAATSSGATWPVEAGANVDATPWPAPRTETDTSGIEHALAF